MATDEVNEGSKMLAKRRRRLEATIWGNHVNRGGKPEKTTPGMGNFGLFDNLANSDDDLTYIRRMAALRGYTDEE